MRRPPLLLAFDTSLACTGWLALTCDGAELVEAGSIVTTSGVPRDEYFLLRMRDDAYRAYALKRAVDALAWRWDGRLSVVAMESPSGVPHSKKRGAKHGAPDAFAFGKMVRAQQAVLDGLDPSSTGLRPIFVSVYAAKAAATGKKRPKGGKAAVAAAVRKRWPASQWERVLADVATERDREAVFDAAAVALEAIKHPAVRLAAEDHQRALEPAARRTP